MLIFYLAISLNLLVLIVFFVCMCVFFIFHIWSCHLQRGIVLLLSFQFGCLLFPFSWHIAQVITFRTTFPIQFWIEAVKAGIVVVPDLRCNSFSLSLFWLRVYVWKQFIDPDCSVLQPEDTRNACWCCGRPSVSGGLCSIHKATPEGKQ